MRWLKYFRLPPFATVVVISGVLLVVSAGWMLLDAGFNRQVVDVLRRRLADGDALSSILLTSPRVVCFTLLAALAAASALLVIYLAFFGHAQGRSWRRRLGAVALVVLWIALVASRDWLGEAGFHLRVRRALAGLRQDADVLTTNWPQAEETLPFSGRCFPLPDAPDVLCRFWRPGMVIRSPYTLSVATYGFIYRAPGGTLRFEVIAEDWASIVEYRPDGSQPASFDQSYGEGGVLKHRLKRSRQLAPEWFLVDYDKSWR
jgi:hypothetical protein